jgi:hypothetical protein
MIQVLINLNARIDGCNACRPAAVPGCERGGGALIVDLHEANMYLE